ncbi:MAG: glutathione S-transferase family protein [Betaproteobacteria bacterium]|nr:glutathione S-transferase family protein [Betaproteobacteria bacterium]
MARRVRPADEHGESRTFLGLRRGPATGDLEPGAARLARSLTGPLAQANPRAEVPLLIDGPDVRIFESTVILEYIEERWPQPPLLPRSPAARAFARQTEEICDTQYEAINWGWGEILWFRRAEGELAKQLGAEARRQTRLMQEWLADRLGQAVRQGSRRGGRQP